MEDGIEPPNIPREQLLNMLSERTELLCQAIELLQKSGKFDHASDALKTWWASYQADLHSFVDMVKRTSDRSKNTTSTKRR
jgi:hypothetical protein